MTAVVREIDGQLVLDDPEALAVIRALEKHNCKNTLNINLDRVRHFLGRMKDRGLTAKDAVIVILNVDDQHGGPLADALMPGFDWQPFRDRGEIPFARGLAGRDGLAEIVAFFDKEAAEKLSAAITVSVLVVDRGVAEVYDAEQVLNPVTSAE